MRWFLAHTKTEALPRLEQWSKQLTETLTETQMPDHTVSANIVTGRGWRSWCSDVSSCRKYDNQPLFHGVIVPVDFESPIIGKATSILVEGFFDHGKHVFAWDYGLNEFRRISHIQEIGLDNWRAWARLILE